jgi:hypothetical protein
MARTGRSKLDGLPEEWEYRDEGCDLAPSCLRCPFPRCRYDEEGGIAGFKRRERDSELRRLRDEGLSPTELAARFNVSLRSVYRILTTSPAKVAAGADKRIAEPAPVWITGIAA